MISFRLRNIQAIEDATWYFEEDHGLVQFVGNNSNGKSILGKILHVVIFQELDKEEKRLPLINDNCEEGSLFIQWNQKQLGVILHRDINKCCYIYKDGDKDIVRRGLRQDGISQMLRAMGFLIYGKNSVCLQICETFGPMPFINTSDLINGEIVNAVCTEVSSEMFLKNYNETFKEAKRLISMYNADIARNEAIVDSTHYRNLNALPALTQELYKLYQRGRIMTYTILNHLDIPFVFRSDLDIVSYESFSIPRHLEEIEEYNTLEEVISEIQEILSGRCPTCGIQYMMEG